MPGSADPHPKKDPKKDPEDRKGPQENDVRKDSTPAGVTREKDTYALLTVEEIAARLAGFTGPCAVAGIPLRGLVVPGPGGIDPARVRVAGSLMSIYLYGMRLMFFPAVVWACIHTPHISSRGPSRTTASQRLGTPT